MLFLATVLKFALHRSTTSSLNCATLSHPVNLSTVDIRWQTVTERSETAELPQWTAYRKPSAIFRMVPSLTLLWPPFLFFFPCDVAFCQITLTTVNVLLSVMLSQKTVAGALYNVSSQNLIVGRTQSSFGDRTFAVAAPQLWTSLPSDIRQPDLSYWSV